MSTPPCPKRRKLNNDSYINASNCNGKNLNIDLDGALNLSEALLMERQCIISLLKYRKNIDLSNFFEWILKIQTEQTSIVMALKQCFENSLNAIDSLQEINQTLNEERDTLMDLLNGDIVNINTQNINKNDNKCYQLMSQRICIIRDLMEDEHKNNDNIIDHNANDDDNEDSELQIIESKKSIKCPLTQCTIKYPKKSIKCRHIFECFAIVDYIINKQTNIYYFADIQCPACKYKISLDDLITDYNMMELLRTHTSDQENDTKNIDATPRIVDLAEDKQEIPNNTNNNEEIKDIIKSNSVDTDLSVHKQNPPPLEDII